MKANTACKTDLMIHLIRKTRKKNLTNLKLHKKPTKYRPNSYLFYK